jgi:homopolymeric O-antigen transport system permease protein
LTAITELRDSRELLLNLTLREVRGKYKRTLLGQGWSLLNPIAQLAIYTAVFGFVLRTNPGVGDPSGLDNFALWLGSALLPWAFMTNGMNAGMGALVGNANLIKKVYFPRETLVGSAVLSWTVSFGLELLVLTVALTLFGGDPWPYLPLVVLFVVVLTAFSMGLGLALSVANVYFRDTQHFIAIISQVWFYATPIIYPVSLLEAHKNIPHWVFVAYRLNPMERFSEVFRNLLYDNRLPGLISVAYVLVVSALVLVGGYAIFRRFEGRLAEEL